MSDLFEIPETLSPRLRWMQTHGVEVHDSGVDHEDGDECDITGNQCYRYYATCGEQSAGGHTKDEAIFALAVKLQLKLWNES
jgi:hypothetical protein